MIGVEPELAADARDSLHEGQQVAWPPEFTQQTIADALRADQVGALPLQHMLEYVDDIVTVTEDEITRAVRRLALEARLIAEPGGAVAVAACLLRRKDLPAPGPPWPCCRAATSTPGCCWTSWGTTRPPGRQRQVSWSRHALYFCLHHRADPAFRASPGSSTWWVPAACCCSVALVISGIISFVVLSRQRDAMSGAIASRIGGFRERLDQGTRAEDDD